MAVFKAYDIRGIFGVELTEEVVVRIGHAFAVYFNDEVMVGMDTRIHSPRIFSWLADGIRRRTSVTFLGTITTPIAHYAARTLRKPVLMITASHNPPEYNGIKAIHRTGYDLESHELKKVEELTKLDPPQNFVGYVKAYDVLEDYYGYMLERFSGISEFRIGFDPGNGAGVVLVDLLKRLGLDVRGINTEADGRFPAHLPDPEKEANLQQLREFVVSNKLDMGIALDGDGDRVGIVLKDGRVFRPEKMVYTFINTIAKPGDTIVLDVTMPIYLEEYAKSRGIRVVRQRTGHTFMKPTAAREDAIFWAEYSGHIGFRENFYTDDGIYAALTLLKIVREYSLDLTEVLDEAPPVLEKRIDIRVENQHEVARLVRDYVEREGIGDERYYIDGVDIRMYSGRLLIRPSNTEPLIRVKIEAPNESSFNLIESLCRSILQSVLQKVDARTDDVLSNPNDLNAL